ncbi:MAG: sigma-54-dependent transcriptional regulator [Vicinamibacterales bacterium]
MTPDLPFLADELVGQSPAAVQLRDLVRRAAPLEGGVLLVGESGVDVAAVARDIHDRSHPSVHPWCRLACAEGDPAGHDRAIFGAPVSQDDDLVSVTEGSLIAAARGGTLFLQDVTELPAGLQARLARAFRDGEVRLAGADVPIAIRLMASALPSIDEDLRTRRFRHDLYRRLAVSRIDLPPLRERTADIAPLAERLVKDICQAASRPAPALTHAAQALLAAVAWPRNLAGLKGALERIVPMVDGPAIQIEHLLAVLPIERPAPSFTPAGTLRDARARFEREYIGAVLRHHAWQLGDAARTLGIQRPNLYRKARQLGIPLAKQSA